MYLLLNVFHPTAWSVAEPTIWKASPPGLKWHFDMLSECRILQGLYEFSASWNLRGVADCFTYALKVGWKFFVSNFSLAGLVSPKLSLVVGLNNDGVSHLVIGGKSYFVCWLCFLKKLPCLVIIVRNGNFVWWKVKKKSFPAQTYLELYIPISKWGQCEMCFHSFLYTFFF